MSSMTDTQLHGPAAGIALALSGIATVLASVIEFAPGNLARGDGDNPADSLAYLNEHGTSYSYSGLALVIGGALLVVAVVGIYRITAHMASLAYSATSVFGVLAGGFLVVAGVMRMQAVGTVPHIQSLNESWGEAAYLAVQMAGTQGLLSAGVMALAAWLVSLTVLFAMCRLWAPVAFGVFPLIVLLVLATDLIFPTLAESSSSEILFLAYIAALAFGMPLCSAACGIALSLPQVRRVLAGETAAA